MFFSRPSSSENTAVHRLSTSRKPDDFSRCIRGQFKRIECNHLRPSRVGPLPFITYKGSYFSCFPYRTLTDGFTLSSVYVCNCRVVLANGTLLKCSRYLASPMTDNAEPVSSSITISLFSSFIVTENGFFSFLSDTWYLPTQLFCSVSSRPLPCMTSNDVPDACLLPVFSRSTSECGRPYHTGNISS